MRSRAAVLRETPGDFEIVEIDIDAPRQNELLVQTVAAGICHSDDHMRLGDLKMALPMVGGHEGAGVVVGVGPNTVGFEEGDHVVLAWIPSCGRCRWCAQGRQNLCDLGAQTLTGARPDDPDSYRFHLDGRDLAQVCGVGAFSEFTVVSVASAIKIPKHLSLEAASLAACSVGTGWGSAVKVGAVGPGDVVIVAGVGGVGIHAVQGAAMAGAAHVLVAEPIAHKRDAALAYGATAAFENLAEASDAARALTNGQGADVAILTIGVVEGSHVQEALGGIRKGGAVVVVGLGGESARHATFSAFDLALSEKRILGSLYGSCTPTYDIPMLLRLYDEGLLEIDDFISRRYPLERINDGFADMSAGEVIKGIVTYP